MIIVLKPDATRQATEAILDRIASAGLQPLHMPGAERVVLGAIGDERVLAGLHLESDPSVESVKPILAPYKLVSREMQQHDTIVRIGSTAIGGSLFRVIAGPRAVESREQLFASAAAAKQAGATALRADMHAGHSGPYSAEMPELPGLALLREVGDELGLPIVTEIGELADLDSALRLADAIMIGGSNMQNSRLLRAVGQADKPVLLRRGRSARVEELFLAAEHLIAAGNAAVVLCEGGVRTFEAAMPSTLDLNAIPYIKRKTHLPVLVDPSQGTGMRELVTPMALAAAACGADGLLVEVHENPAAATFDGAQSLYPDQFKALMDALAPVVRAVGREM